MAKRPSKSAAPEAAGKHDAAPAVEQFLELVARLIARRHLLEHAQPPADQQPATPPSSANLTKKQARVRTSRQRSP